MNKKLLTAAIGAALVAGPMLAQADVKVYGKLHMSVDAVNPGDKGASNDASSRKGNAVSSNASRWGIDVSEKLGGGLTAIAKLEQTIFADGDTNSQDARNRYVGLKGGFGTVLAGIHDTPFKDVSRKLELFPEQIGDTRNILRQKSLAVGGTNATLDWDARRSNVVAYVSPNFNGFSATYAYSADATPATGTEDNRRRADSLGITYASGPLYVAYARESHRFNNIADGGQPAETGDRLGASYNFGAFKVVALYQDLKDMGGTVSGNSSIKRKSWVLGGAYTAGNNVFKLQYAKADDLSNNSAGASQPETGAKMWAVGWDHLFSKTTKAYVAYAKTDNGTNAAFTVNGPTAGEHGDAISSNAGGDPSAWSVGMIVDF